MTAMLTRGARDYQRSELSFMTREQLVETCTRLESRRQMMEILLAELHNERTKLQRHQTMLTERIARVEGSISENGTEVLHHLETKAEHAAVAPPSAASTTAPGGSPSRFSPGRRSPTRGSPVRGSPARGSPGRPVPGPRGPGGAPSPRAGAAGRSPRAPRPEPQAVPRQAATDAGPDLALKAPLPATEPSPGGSPPAATSSTGAGSAEAEARASGRSDGDGFAAELQERLTAGRQVTAPEELLVRQTSSGSVRLTWFYNERLLEQLADPAHPLRGLSFEVRQQSEGASGRLRSRTHHCECRTLYEGDEAPEQSFEVEGCVLGKAYAFSVRARARFDGFASPVYSPYSETITLGDLVLDCSASNYDGPSTVAASTTVSTPRLMPEYPSQAPSGTATPSAPLRQPWASLCSASGEEARGHLDIEEAARRQVEEEVRRRAEAAMRAEREATEREDEARRQLEATRRRFEEDAAQRRAVNEEARRKAEEGRRADEEARRRRDAEAALRRIEEEEARRRIEQEATHRRVEEEVRRRLDEERRKLEEAAGRAAAEEETSRRRDGDLAMKRQLDQEAAQKRIDEEVMRRVQDERLRLAREARLAEEAARRRLEEEAAQRDERRMALLEQAQRREEEERRRAQEALRGEEELRRRLEEEALQRRAEEKRRRWAEEEARAAAEDEARQRDEDLWGVRERERQEKLELERAAEEARRANSEARQRLEEAARRRHLEDPESPTLGTPPVQSSPSVLGRETRRESQERTPPRIDEDSLQRRVEAEIRLRVETEARRRAGSVRSWEEEAGAREEERRRGAEEDTQRDVVEHVRRRAEEEIRRRVEEESHRAFADAQAQDALPNRWVQHKRVGDGSSSFAQGFSKYCQTKAGSEVTPTVRRSAATTGASRTAGGTGCSTPLSTSLKAVSEGPGSDGDPSLPRFERVPTALQRDAPPFDRLAPTLQRELPRSTARSPSGARTPLEAAEARGSRPLEARGSSRLQEARDARDARSGERPAVAAAESQDAWFGRHLTPICEQGPPDPAPGQPPRSRGSGGHVFHSPVRGANTAPPHANLSPEGQNRAPAARCQGALRALHAQPGPGVDGLGPTVTQLPKRTSAAAHSERGPLRQSAVHSQAGSIDMTRAVDMQGMNGFSQGPNLSSSMLTSAQHAPRSQSFASHGGHGGISMSGIMTPVTASSNHGLHAGLSHQPPLQQHHTNVQRATSFPAAFHTAPPGGGLLPGGHGQPPGAGAGYPGLRGPQPRPRSPARQPQGSAAFAGQLAGRPMQHPGVSPGTEGSQRMARAGELLQRMVSVGGSGAGAGAGGQLGAGPPQAAPPLPFNLNTPSLLHWAQEQHLQHEQARYGDGFPFIDQHLPSQLPDPDLGSGFRGLGLGAGSLGLRPSAALESDVPPPPRIAPFVIAEGATPSGGSAAGQRFELTVLTSDSRWETLEFSACDDLDHRGSKFLEANRLKAAFHPGLVAKMRSMITLCEPQASVDIVDLL